MWQGATEFHALWISAAEVAFDGDISFVVEEYLIEWACLDACFSTIAFFTVDNWSVQYGIVYNCANCTCRDAGRVVTLVADFWSVSTAQKVACYFDSAFTRIDLSFVTYRADDLTVSAACADLCVYEKPSTHACFPGRIPCGLSRRLWISFRLSFCNVSIDGMPVSVSQPRRP